MAWLAKDKDDSEFIYKKKPVRKSNASEDDYFWYGGFEWFELPKGSILKLIGRELTWNDEPVEI